MRFIIDTGAETSIINPNLCNPKWKVDSELKFFKTLGHYLTSNIRYKIPLFSIFEEENYYVDFMEYPFHSTFDGLIGNNILNPLDCIIDYSNRTIKTKHANIPFFMNIEEENYYNNSFKDNPIEVFFKETDSINLLDYIKTSHMNYEEKLAMSKIILSHKKIFYKDGDHLPATSYVMHSINTKNDIPIYSKMYRYPHVHKKEVDKQIAEMLENKIIIRSNSPYNAPLWIVPKKVDNSGSQKWRIVIDYRKLNDNTIEDRFPIPNIEDIFEKLGRSIYFTTLDLAKGFHQIRVDPKDRPKTAFSTATGHFEFSRMPFGLKNAPATFQRLINDVLSEYINKICVVYMDDILIFSGSLQEHVVSINKIFKKLIDANLKVQIDKCSFFTRETKFLGHVITEEGIKPNPAKVEAILKLDIPKTQKQIKSFLGITGYYRKFIRDYAKVALPLTKCLQKGSQINSNKEEYVEAFKKLKTLLTSDPILVYPDFERPFTLTTDASDFALGAVLSQNNHPIAYISRTLNKHERNYATIEKELLAIVWATQQFRPYLFGLKIYNQNRS